MSVLRESTWIWQFDSPPERIWPILADTARFNEAADLPKHQVKEIPGADGSVRFFADFTFGPFTVHGEEHPVNWVHGRWFEHCRSFSNGPFRFLCAGLRIFPQAGGCRVEYTIRLQPANFAGRCVLAAGFFQRTERNFERLVESARAFARGARDTPFDCRRPPLADGAEPRARVLVEQIEATPHGHGLAQRLAEYVLTRPEVDVWAIRPLRLAREWERSPREVIEACLQAAKLGLLGMRWDLLCPRCQVGKASVPALDQLPAGAHCSSCNIDYDREYSSNVELTFHPGRAIRPLTSGEYCLFGPMSTPHVKAQLTVATGKERVEEVDLEPGSYRVRTLEAGDEETFDWPGGAFPMVTVNGTQIAVRPGNTPGECRICNEGPVPRTVIVEERVWRRDALTAKRATALQAFRDLFTEDVLRPGDDVQIDSITLMFTDLKGSTALYERIGDPQAYAVVREHYAIIGQAVRRHDGCIVKTIGDAVMGAFNDPGDAFRCGVQLQHDFDAFNNVSGREPVVIKLGFHMGRCISVTLNDRLDYYGSAANLAARLESQSQGGDMVLSLAFANDPAVAALLSGIQTVREEATFKGFDQPVPYVRIRAAELARITL